MSALAPCPSCQRHVFVSDAVCPFCGSRAARVARTVPRGLSRSGLSRAAIVALGATTTVMAGACGDDDDGDTTAIPVYGAPVMTSSAPGSSGSVPDSPTAMPTGSATASQSTTVPPNPVPMYGLPIMPGDPAGAGGNSGQGPDATGGTGGSSEDSGGSADAGTLLDAGSEMEPDASSKTDAAALEPEPFDGGLDPDNPEPSVAPLYGLPSMR